MPSRSTLTAHEGFEENEILEKLPERFRKVYRELSVLRENYHRPAAELRRTARSVFESVLELRQLTETERVAMLAELIAGYDPAIMAPDNEAAQRTHLIRRIAGATSGELKQVAGIFSRSARHGPKHSYPTLPTKPPEEWSARVGRKENPIAFIRRVWGPFLGRALTRRSQLANVDLPLYRALGVWLHRHPTDSIPELDPTEEAIDEAIARLTSVFTAEEITRVGLALHRQRNGMKRPRT